MRITTLILAAFVALPTVAHAQSIETVATEVIEADATYTQGAGAPTVVWDADEARFVMFFEAAWTADGCDDAWAIGSATSPDGLVWSVGSPVLLPGASDDAPCGFRRPAATHGPDGEIALFVNVVDQERDDRVARVELSDDLPAEEPVDSMVASPTTRGALTAPRGRSSAAVAGRGRAPEMARGQGRGPLPLMPVATLEQAAPEASGPVVTLLPELDGLVAPTVAVWEGEWVLLGIHSDPSDQSIVSARSTDGLTWTVDAQDAIHMGATPWSRDGTLSPSLVCKDASSWPWELYYGGWRGAESAWTYGISNTANAWYVTPALDTWTDDSAWLSWDAVKVGSSTVVFFEQLDANGLPSVGVAANAPSWNPADALSRACTDPS